MAQSVKDIEVRVIPAKIGNAFVARHHYSGKYVQNSKLHFGCYLNGVLHGVMSYGSPMDKSKVIGLVDTGLDSRKSWNRMLELNRMAFDDVLPKNAESRCLSISFKLLRKHAPHIDWILSFSDGTASGDGTIYRAVGFKLTQIKRNTTMYIFPDGSRIALLPLTNAGDQSSRKETAKKYGAVYTSGASMKPFIDIGAKPAPGFQLRYIKLLNPTCTLNCAEIPYTAIDEAGAGMLRGQRITRAERQGQ